MAIDEDLETWADAADVRRFTGQETDQDNLVRAQDIIELFAGTTFSSTDNVSQTNLRRLNRAVAYQAGWMVYRPDLFTGLDVDSVSQDGASYSPGHVNAALLAPFAKRHLDRLTWRLKPLRVRRRRAHDGEYGDDPYGMMSPRDSAVADDNRPWGPM